MKALTYCGLPLCEWRGAYRAILRARWYVFYQTRPAETANARRHAAIVAVATMALPVSWHAAHRGRLSETHYTVRRSWLSTWRPLPRMRAPAEVHER